MNYGLYRVEGKSDCPQRCPEHLPDAVAEAGDPASDRGKLLRKQDTSSGERKSGRQEPSFFRGPKSMKKLLRSFKKLIVIFCHKLSLTNSAECIIMGEVQKFILQSIEAQKTGVLLRRGSRDPNGERRRGRLPKVCRSCSVFLGTLRKRCNCHVLCVCNMERYWSMTLTSSALFARTPERKAVWPALC